MKSTVAALEFGSSKIITLIAETGGNARCNIVGAGNVPYSGYLDGAWLDSSQDFNDAIAQSISAAESGCKKKIQDINVGVPGEFAHVYTVEASVQIQGADPRVTPKHVNEVFENAAKLLSPVKGTIIHRSPAWFMVDGGKKTLEPVNMKGSELKAMISYVVADAFFVQDIAARLMDLNIRVAGFFSTNIGEAMLYLPESDREQMCVLIDVGYMYTDVMVVEGDAIIFHQSLAIGGADIAADLSEKLDIHMVAAEKIKRDYVFNLSNIDQNYTVALESDGIKTATFTQKEVAEALEPTVDELAAMILQCISDSGIKLDECSPAYLTGGGLAFNRGGCNYLAGRLGMSLKVVNDRTYKLTTHIFAGALGLMDLVIDTMEQQGAQERGLIGGVKEFFRGLWGD